TSYHIWLRLRATADSKWNDSVWVQLSDSNNVSGSAVYRIGTTNALLVNLESCSGCGDSGWGWMDANWWMGQSAVVQFPTPGHHTIRVQTREDGVNVDQIVLSPANYLSSAPGAIKNDATIVPKPSAAPPPPPPPPPPGSTSTPFYGTPAAIPGTINAADF